MLAILAAFLLSSCNPAISPLSGKETPNLFPIKQNDMWGYINRQGEIVIQPQFSKAWFFSEDLAVACIEPYKCGFIDETGKFVVNPQFESVSNFSEGLAVVQSEKKIGYIDKTGKFAISPQFDLMNIEIYSSFSESLATVKIGNKYGFIDKTGKFVINPQFEFALPFTDGLAAIKIGSKWGSIDKEGKIVIHPQFDTASLLLTSPFINGIAAINVGDQYGYIDKTGKIIITPQFDVALPFSDEGLAMVAIGGKVGFIDKEGKYAINPQFEDHPGKIDLTTLNLGFKKLGRASFSEGLAPVKIGNSAGYIDKTGRIVINPQFNEAFPFYGGLAWVWFGSDSDIEYAWIDKTGKTVWRETKETPETSLNSSISYSNVAVVVNSNSMSGDTMSNSNIAVVVNSTNSSYDNMTMNSPPQSSNNSTSSKRIGRLTTDSNVRSEPNKDSTSLGIHFKDAKVKILDETSYELNGMVSTWFKIRVTEYGCSKDLYLGCGKNSSDDADEGWVNAKVVLLN